MVFYLKSLHREYENMSAQNPTSVLNCIETIFSNLYKIAFIFSLWKNKHLMENTLNYMTHDPYLKVLEEQRGGLVTYFISMVLCD